MLGLRILHFQVTLKELNITSAAHSAADATVKVTDVWSGEDAGAIVGGTWDTGVVAPMDSRFVVFETAVQ